MTLPQALIEMDLIDEFEFLVHPIVAGAGRALFDGLSKPLDLRLMDRQEMPGGHVALTYEPIR